MAMLKSGRNKLSLMIRAELCRIDFRCVIAGALIVLACAGHLTEIRQAMSNLTIEYNETTYQLATQAAAIIAALEPEARAIHDANVELYFPKGTATISGGMYSYMNLDLEIISGEMLYTERYGFCYDTANLVWFFVGKNQVETGVK